ncbi:hypothetical protein NicSoilB4_12330 [Arthrobacter sp. NicSoilB4]|nr:hypothetical protein NicSoilB4_12330 [Arthrobacter sp. NicSoilB4]
MESRPRSDAGSYLPLSAPPVMIPLWIRRWRPNHLGFGSALWSTAGRNNSLLKAEPVPVPSPFPPLRPGAHLPPAPLPQASQEAMNDQ